MAQLIKLRDYISRYETNPFHYPTQFIRLKQENWHKLMNVWEEENEEQWKAEQEVADMRTKEATGRFRWNPFKQTRTRAKDAVLFKRNLPESKDKLREYFLNQLYPFQLKWATSTLTQVSYTERDHFFDQDLKFFLQHFPDIYLVMYYPIFNIKNAPIDVEIILISPVEIEIITLLNYSSQEMIVVGDDRTWTIEREDNDERIISPTIGLKRTERIVEGILQAYDLSYTIRKTVLSRDAYFLYVTEPCKVSLVGPNEYKTWYDQKRDLSGSLKGAQLKVMEALLEHSFSNSVRRPEWERDKEEEDSPFMIED